MVNLRYFSSSIMKNWNRTSIQEATADSFRFFFFLLPKIVIWSWLIDSSWVNVMWDILWKFLNFRFVICFSFVYFFLFPVFQFYQFRIMIKLGFSINLCMYIMFKDRNGFLECFIWGNFWHIWSELGMVLIIDKDAHILHLLLETHRLLSSPFCNYGSMCLCSTCSSFSFPFFNLAVPIQPGNCW